MATVLGKRKKPSSAATATTATDDSAIQDIFRRHFEAQFKPLPEVAKKDKTKKTKKTSRTKEGDSKGNKIKNSDTVLIQENESDLEGEDDDEEASLDESDDDWSGLSDDDELDGQDTAPAVQVVDYSTAEPTAGSGTTMSKRERKLYLSSRPPSTFDDDAKSKAKPNKRGGDADTDADGTKQYKDAPDLLANDLALQRLISESHLLAGAFALPSSFSTSAGAASTYGAAGLSNPSNNNHKSGQPFAAGRLRQRTTDLRIQAVANKAKGDAAADTGLITVNNAKDSIFTQAKMPMSMRKGIVAAATDRETKRRREARESGIVLERPAAVKPTKTSKRLRGVDGPAVGRMRGSELKLRKRDVRAIEGPKRTMGKMKKRR